MKRKPSRPSEPRYRNGSCPRKLKQWREERTSGRNRKRGSTKCGRIGSKPLRKVTKFHSAINLELVYIFYEPASTLKNNIEIVFKCPSNHFSSLVSVWPCHSALVRQPRECGCSIWSRKLPRQPKWTSATTGCTHSPSRVTNNSHCIS